VAEIVIDGLGKVYTDGTRAVDDLSFTVEEGDPIPGRPRFFCQDPAGNRLEFLEDHT
jgi:hypothetical protein